MTDCDNSPSVTVERVNLSPAPMQLRVLCHLRMKWASEFEPFSGTEYQPIVTADAADGALQVA